MDPVTATVVALTATSAYSQYQAGIAKQQEYDRKAQLEELRGRNDALAHREQGIKIMDNTLAQMAYSNAYAAAGGTDPYSGSKLGASQIIQQKGIREFEITQYNKDITIGMANYQASIYRFAGKQAKRQGTMNAMMTVVQGAYMYNQMGGMSGKPTTTAPSSYGSYGSGQGGFSGFTPSNPYTYGPQGTGPSMDIYR